MYDHTTTPRAATDRNHLVQKKQPRFGKNNPLMRQKMENYLMRESRNENITPLISVSENEDIESNDSQNQNEFVAHDEKEFLELQLVD
ncbi:hypothetical protein TNCV_2876721 [Trichonephila clavipes]|uniref:Uncharacterized protein n=1 Tax=Trichonephila clavipes TaxID=2585209 RepID=A0A8X6WDJ0_TRICX|nr:hypothetical protein TNCV_2876721 [Trichonephila clavipes]